MLSASPARRLIACLGLLALLAQAAALPGWGRARAAAQLAPGDLVICTAEGLRVIGRDGVPKSPPAPVAHHCALCLAAGAAALPPAPALHLPAQPVRRADLAHPPAGHPVAYRHGLRPGPRAPPAGHVEPRIA